jgi:hypothetical protein
MLRESGQRCLTPVEVDKGSELLRWWMFGHLRESRVCGILFACS